MTSSENSKFFTTDFMTIKNKKKIKYPFYQLSNFVQNLYLIFYCFTIDNKKFKTICQ